MGPRRANEVSSHVGGVVSGQASGAAASSSASRGRQAAPAPAQMGARGAEERGVEETGHITGSVGAGPTAPRTRQG